ncbi:MAG: UPF0236 family protein [Acetobacteraceae bacterium]|nr:UPF0236 family protein [Acetobacteraceae bacterium]
MKERLLNGELTLDEVLLEAIRRSLPAARRLMLMGLKRVDRRLRDERDKARYESRGSAPREVETRFGTVRLRRRRYWDRQEQRIVFLLDEWLERTGEEEAGEAG